MNGLKSMPNYVATKQCAVCEKTIKRNPKWSTAQWEEKTYCSIECRGNRDQRKKEPKLKIAFVWQGVSNQQIKDAWQDGLRYAIDKIAKTHDVRLHEPWDDIHDVDVILYWEAPVTAQGVNAPHYHKVRQNPTKKALLFAGGPIRKEWVDGFNLLFLESKINEKECDDLGIKWAHAFGVNTSIFKTKSGLKTKVRKYDGMLHGTCASWKRQWLIGDAIGSKGLVIGRNQESDPYPFNRCRELGVEVLDAMYPTRIREYMYDSYTLINPCDYWGGGQRATLEAMACGLPVICCTDSPKNIEFIQDSGYGRIVEPSGPAIRQAVEDLKNNPVDPYELSKYVQEKWSGDVYAEQLLKGIKIII